MMDWNQSLLVEEEVVVEVVEELQQLLLERKAILVEVEVAVEGVVKIHQ